MSPESNDGWPTVAASACSAGNDKSKQIPPVVIANRVTRRMTRRVFGFDIDNSKSPGNSHPPYGCPAMGTRKIPRQPMAVADERSVRSPTYSIACKANKACDGLGEVQSSPSRALFAAQAILYVGDRTERSSATAIG